MTKCRYCKRRIHARFMCPVHYNRWYRKNQDKVHKRKPKKTICKNCGKDVTGRTYDTRRLHRRGDCIKKRKAAKG